MKKVGLILLVAALIFVAWDTIRLPGDQELIEHYYDNEAIFDQIEEMYLEDNADFQIQSDGDYFPIYPSRGRLNDERVDEYHQLLLAGDLARVDSNFGSFLSIYPKARVPQKYFIKMNPSPAINNNLIFTDNETTRFNVAASRSEYPVVCRQVLNQWHLCYASGD